MLFDQGSFIKVSRSRCLNTLHHEIGCNHCVTSCPSQSIHMINGKVAIDKENCSGCGLCLTDCPTEAFSAQPWDETSIFIEIDKQKKDVTQFFCDDHESPYLSKKEKDKAALQVPVCLGSISRGAWYEIGLKTKVEIRLDRCEHCSMKECLENLNTNVNTAMEWLEASGHESDFSLIYTVDHAIKRKKLMAVSTGMKTTSRRDIFLSLFNQGKEVIDRARESNLEDYQIKRKQKKKSLQTTWKKRFSKTYVAHFQEGGNPAYWPAITKKESCVNCGICKANCPTQALQIKMENGVATHTFNSGKCIDCRLCMLFCPTESISRYREEKLAPFSDEFLLERTSVPCKHCGEMSTNDSDLCYWCENEAEDSQMISDVWKHLMG